MTSVTDEYEFHPACLVMPPQTAIEFEALRASIRAGWNSVHPIVVHENRILDGRHRYLACRVDGIEPTFVDWDGSAFDWNPFKFVRIEHDARRNWQSQEQRHLCLIEMLEKEGVIDAERNRVAKEANAARSAAAKEQHVVSNPRVGETMDSGGDSVRVATRKKKTGESKSRSSATGVDRNAAQRADKIARLAKEQGADDVLQGVKNGTVKAHAALKSLEEKTKAAALAAPVVIALPEGIHHGDFKLLASSIPDESVELVFTDPPYDRDAVQLYEAAAREAARILKPGGSMIAYSGQRFLPEVLAGMSQHLRYWWTIAGVHDGGNQMLQKLGIRCGWKPLVWFVKDTRGDVQNVILDVVRGDREKDSHKWQQAQSEAEYYVSELCSENGVVVDFFLGGGTTAAACRATGRRFIGFDTDAGAITKSVERLAA